MAQEGNRIQDIVRELAQGLNEKENFRLLYNHYAGVIGGFFQKKGVPEWEELKDDVFLAVYKNVKGLRDETKFEYWLFTIARNTYKNWLKRERARKALCVSLESDGDVVKEIDSPATLATNPELGVLERERVDKVWTALQELPPQKRLVVILAWVEGRSPKEIATILPVTINTVYAHLHQAQKILKEQLGEIFQGMNRGGM